ncbi:MAG: ribosylglycohydrolase [Actinobacteria bacterium HGW-Actinobacteria-4]|nr:MAG: ribosylglycohydrolase [Actinobacteria bacterium HGW-Actinobacteria-4]
MDVTEQRQSRATGTILGLALGDALGAPYEFHASPGITLRGDQADMCGGGDLGWAPGEWTDDTSMAIPILREVAAGADLLSPPTQNRIVAAWKQWAADAPDVGIHTRQVLSGLAFPAMAEARQQAQFIHEAYGKSGGNGSLMRTAPVALAYLEDATAERTAQAARALSELTHVEADASDACVIWTVAIRDAVLRGSVDVGHALSHVPEPRRTRWRTLLADAHVGQPGNFGNNGWVVAAAQEAWCALSRAGLDVADPATHTPKAFRQASENAINAGGDTDTVAAITGMLAGALVGARAMPEPWLKVLHGWPGIDAGELVRLSGGGPA